MFFDGIDIRRLRRDVASASAQCLALKRALRRRWTGPMADQQRALARVARRVTELCILLARTRGRWHVTPPRRGPGQPDAGWDHEAYNTKVAERVALDYQAPGPALAPAGAAS